jgi:hypothetical protein
MNIPEITFFMYDHSQKAVKTIDVKVFESKRTQGINRTVTIFTINRTVTIFTINRTVTIFTINRTVTI